VSWRVYQDVGVGLDAAGSWRWTQDPFIGGGKSATKSFAVSRTRGWYDLVVTAAHDAAVELRYAGHLENGRESISDPAMGGLLP